MSLTQRQLELAILELLADGQHQHKINLIGRPHQSGPLESKLGVAFGPEDRQMADRAFDALKARSLIRPTYSDLVNPELWVAITPTGKEALEMGALDDLDAALTQIAPHLVQIRAGAWEAVMDSRPDALRQAAHSGRELIDQVLKEGAPDDEVRAQPAFVADSSSKTGVTRRHRLRYLMEKKKGQVSSSEMAVAEASFDLVIAIDNKLMAASHARGEVSRQQVLSALQAAETGLRTILVLG